MEHQRHRPFLPQALILLFLLIAGAAPGLAVEPEVSADDEAVTPSKFEKHFLVLLIRPESPAMVDDEKAQEIQSAHLGHLHKLWVDGDALIAGPFEVPADERMRGLVLYRGDLELEEVRSLAEADPAVQAGRLEVQVLPWWHGADLMHFAPPPTEAATSDD